MHYSRTDFRLQEPFLLRKIRTDVAPLPLTAFCLPTFFFPSPSRGVGLPTAGRRPGHCGWGWNLSLPFLCAVLSLVGCAGRAPQSALLALSHADTSIVDVAGPDTNNIYDPLSLLRRGEAYRIRKEYAEASREYERFLQLAPDHRLAPFAHAMLGLCYFNRVGDSDQSPASAEAGLRIFERITTDYPDSLYAKDAADKIIILKKWKAEHQFRIGHFYYKKKAYTAAINRFDPLLQRTDIGDIAEKALYYTCVSYHRNGNRDAAEKTFQRLKTNYPDSAYVRRKKATGPCSAA